MTPSAYPMPKSPPPPKTPANGVGEWVFTAPVSPERRKVGVMEARILTWNLWWQFGPWRDRQEAILSTLQSEQPDIVFLQEVWAQEGGLDQAQWLADEMNMFVARTEGPWYDNGVSLGNAILSRWPIVSWEVHRLPDVTGAPSYRRAVVAHIETPFGRMWTVCTHLDYKFDASATRMAQCESGTALKSPASKTGSSTSGSLRSCDTIPHNASH